MDIDDETKAMIRAVRRHEVGRSMIRRVLVRMLEDGRDLLDEEQFARAAGLLAWHAEIEDGIDQVDRAWGELLHSMTRE